MARNRYAKEQIVAILNEQRPEPRRTNPAGNMASQHFLRLVSSVTV